jgi:sterol desaturase/sphingolipid hydroxylase (fatty acid hydroxylase superfamily)
MEYFDPTTVAGPFFVLACWLESRVLRRQKSEGRSVVGYERKDTIASLAMGTVSLLTVGLLTHGQYVFAKWLWPHRVTDLGAGVLGWTAAMFLWDFLYYWLHRIEHESRIFWAAHVNHHSSEHYNLSTALRQPWTPFLTLLTFPPMALLGVRPAMIITAGGFNLIYQFWIHTETIGRMPKWFELIFNTPSHHRVHHGSNGKYLDCNYAGILIVWDRMFGSFVPEEAPVVYGLTKNIKSFNLLTIAFHEYVAIARDVRRAQSVREGFNRVFAGPGWKPKGSPQPPPSADVSGPKS